MTAPIADVGDAAIGGQRFAIGGRIYGADDPQLQQALEGAYDAPARPLCMCAPGGVEMYVAFHHHYQIKRMPETGDRHHPACPSYEPAPACSGLGELMGDAVVQLDPLQVQLRVDFPWIRTSGRPRAMGEPREAQDVERTALRMSLRALTHFLFGQAGFNRWSPAMSGKRNQAVLHKYLMQAAGTVQVEAEPLSARLYVPEAFSESARAEQAERRRARLAVLHPKEGGQPLALIMGELKGWEDGAFGVRVWIRHMPDAPLLADSKTWARVLRTFAPLVEAADSDGGRGLRLVLTALIRARRENTYEIDRASIMLTSEEWIPLEGVHEAPLVRELVRQGRRFSKPLRYDARTAAGFANAILLDAGREPVALHVMSAFMTPADRQCKERAVRAAGGVAWVWDMGGAMPELPAAAFLRDAAPSGTASHSDRGRPIQSSGAQ